MDATVYTNPDFNVFTTYDMEWINDVNRKPKSFGMSYRRYTINTNTNKVTWRDILVYDPELAEFPNINPVVRGEKHCFTYMIESRWSKDTTSVLKIDHCNNDKVTYW